jgi:hypothetical protein
MRWTLSIGVLLGLAGCSYRYDKIRSVDERLSGETWYAWIDRTILSPRCGGCHGGTHSAGGMNFSSYDKIMATGTITAGDPDKSQLYDAVLSGRMPRDTKLPAGHIDRLREWIAAGAPGPEGVKPEPEKPQPTYSWLNKKLFTPKCARCHEGDEAKGDVNFASYQTLVDSEGMTMKPLEPGDTAASGIYELVASEQMPPGPDKISTDIRAALSEWIRKGAPED